MELTQESIAKIIGKLSEKKAELEKGNETSSDSYRASIKNILQWCGESSSLEYIDNIDSSEIKKIHGILKNNKEDNRKLAILLCVLSDREAFNKYKDDLLTNSETALGKIDSDLASNTSSNSESKQDVRVASMELIWGNDLDTVMEKLRGNSLFSSLTEDNVTQNEKGYTVDLDGNKFELKKEGVTITSKKFDENIAKQVLEMLILGLPPGQKLEGFTTRINGKVDPNSYRSMLEAAIEKCKKSENERIDLSKFQEPKDELCKEIYNKLLPKRSNEFNVASLTQRATQEPGADLSPSPGGP